MHHTMPMRTESPRVRSKIKPNSMHVCPQTPWESNEKGHQPRDIPGHSQVILRRRLAGIIRVSGKSKTHQNRTHRDAPKRRIRTIEVEVNPQGSGGRRRGRRRNIHRGGRRRGIGRQNPGSQILVQKRQLLLPRETGESHRRNTNKKTITESSSIML